MATKLFLRNTALADISTFFDAVITAGSGTATGVVNTTASGTNIQWTRTAGGTVLEWISGRVPSGGFPLSGAVNVAIWANESAMGANSGGRVRLYKRTSGGTETELFTLTSPEINSATAEEVQSEIVNADITIATTDRLVVKYYAQSTSAVNRTVTLYYEGATNYSHIHTPILADIKWGNIKGNIADQVDLTASLNGKASAVLSDSIAYNTAFPFNKYLTYMSHTLTASDVITINNTDAVNQGGGQILFINDAIHTPVLSNFHTIGVYDPAKAYSLLTFIKVHGLFIVSILNFD